MGAMIRDTIRLGVSRGVFSNESGLGSAPIAAAAAQTKNPVSQALVSMTQTFIDTIVVCSLTGFVIISTGLWNSGSTGSELTARAFSHGLPGSSGGIIVAVGLILFAYSTMLGWSYYGEKALEYLFGACFRQIPSAHQCGDHSRPEIVFVAAAYCLVLFEYGRGPLGVT